MTGSINERIILIDEPAHEDMFQGKGHEKTARALAEAIKQFQLQDRAIGLDGGWGSGKSSVVEMAERLLAAERGEKGTKYRFFTFDIWKSQGSSFRRSFLEHLLEWAKQHYPEKRKKLTEIETDVKGKTRELSTDNHTRLDWYGILVLLALPFLPIFYFWSRSEYQAHVEAEIGSFVWSSPMLCLYGFLVVTMLSAFIKQLKRSDWTFSGFWDGLSRTLLIASKQYESQTVTQHIREIDPNDFEFQETLNKVLEVVQSERNKIVVVMDNIDRLPSDELSEYWSATRSIFSNNSHGKKNNSDAVVTAIVPYDRQHLQHAYSDTAGTSNEEENEYLASALKQRELLSKTFDEVLYVSPPIMSNAREFFEDKFSQALPNFEDRDELFRTYLIFSRLLTGKNGHFTPRQIISFINESAGLFSTHLAVFPLSTVAIYICLRDKIESNPECLTDSDLLDSGTRKLASDIDIEKNLAAILYNVDPELALELLLDGRIALASKSDDSNDILELANSKGFDLRVGEVIHNTSSDWISSGEFEKTIANYAELLSTYKGDSRVQIADSLIDAFDSISSIELGVKYYEPYLDLLSIGIADKRQDIAAQLVKKVIPSKEKAIESGVEGGFVWSEFISRLKERLVELGCTDEMDVVIKNVRLPDSAEFILGVSSRSAAIGVPLNLYDELSISFSEDSDEIVKFISNYSGDGVNSFSQLAQAQLVRSDTWVQIGNRIVSVLVNEEEIAEENICDILNMLVDVWMYSGSKKRDDIQISELLQNARFFSMLHTKYEDNLSSKSLGSIVYLSKQYHMKDTLKNPQESSSVTHLQSEIDGFEWFTSILRGDIELEEDAYNRIAKHVVDALKVTEWLGVADSGKSVLLDNVIVQIFLDSVPRNTNLRTILEHFYYLENLLGENMRQALENYALSRNFDSDIEKINISNIPVGFLHITGLSMTDKWEKFRNRIEIQFQDYTGDMWRATFSSETHELIIFNELVSAGPAQIVSPEYRKVLIMFFVEMLQNELPEFSEHSNYDSVMEAVSEEFHPDIYRSVREQLSKVDPIGLQRAIKKLPKVLESVIVHGVSIQAVEKHNVVRHLLCVALEENMHDVLDIFVSMGRRKVGDYINKADQSTKDLLKGCMDTFSKIDDDKKYVKSVIDVVVGKKDKNNWLPFLSLPKIVEESEKNETDESIEK